MQDAQDARTTHLLVTNRVCLEGTGFIAHDWEGCYTYN